MGQISDNFLKTALELTGSFEGCGFTEVTPNFDGQGISCGVLQWCLGQGSLQRKILQPYIVRHGSIDALDIFPEQIDILASETPKNAIRFSMQMQREVNGNWYMKSDWLSGWKMFLNLPEVIDLQVEAANEIGLRVESIYKSFKFTTVNAYCVIFDCLVQNGSLPGITNEKLGAFKFQLLKDLVSTSTNSDTKKNKKIWDNLTVDGELLKLAGIAYYISLRSKKEYQFDVLNRKATLALGVGYVHGDLFKDFYT